MSRDLQLVVFDVETISSADLRQVGAARYARDPSTDILVLTYTNPFYSIPNKVHRWVPGDPLPGALIDATANGALLAAYNVQFDMNIWRWVLVEKYGWPWAGMEAFYDLQADARYAGLPGSLAKCLKALGSGEKDMIGHKLMMKLCKPAKAINADNDPRRFHTGENLTRLYEYCEEDTRGEQRLAKAIPRITESEQAIRNMDLRMNERGVAVDIGLVNAILDIIDVIREARRQELKALTNGAVETENQFANISTFVTDCGYPIESVAKDKLLEYLGDPELKDPKARRVLEIRQEIGKTSLAKLDKMLLSVCADGRLRNMMGYFGAHTGRWASYIVQLQNLPQGILQSEDGVNEYDLAKELVMRRDTDTLRLCYGEENLMDVCVSLIRACLVAQEGRELLVSDFSAIEGRVLAWLAGEESVLEAYRQGKRLYCVAAAGIYNISYEEIFEHRKGKHKKKDKIGKVAELALGYQGGPAAFNLMGKNMGVQVSEEEAVDIRDNWRESRPFTVQFWRDLNECAIAACRHQRKLFKVGFTEKIAFYHSGQHLRMRLPSGRWMTYRNAHIRQKPAPWDENTMLDAVHFWGVNSFTKNWELLDTYGGKLAENCTQAVARDLMALAMLRAEKAGLHPVLTVHDEIVVDEPIGKVACAQLDRIMTKLPDWAKTLPIGAESWSGSYYRK